MNRDFFFSILCPLHDLSSEDKSSSYVPVTKFEWQAFALSKALLSVNNLIIL